MRARYTSLAREVERIAALAGLGIGAARLPDGQIQFGVRPPRERSADSAAPVIFSPHLGTAASLAYTEAGLRSRNAVYVLGSGSAETRIVELVTDPDDLALHGRREFSLDARDASTAAAGPIDYPGDWTLGDIVTIDLPDLGLRFNRRIEAVRLQAGAGEPLQIDCAFGAPPPDAAEILRASTNAPPPPASNDPPNPQPLPSGPPFSFPREGERGWGKEVGET